MFTVGVLSQKGGVGKSTVVRSLAIEALASRQSCGIVDADPQATTSAWSLRRAAKKTKHPAVSAATTPALLRQAIADARDEGWRDVRRRLDFKLAVQVQQHGQVHHLGYLAQPDQSNVHCVSLSR